MSERLNPDGLILSDQYTETMNDAVLPYLKERQTDLRVEGFEGKPLFCSAFRADQARGTVVIVHGFTENAFKYAEIIFFLL